MTNNNKLSMLETLEKDLSRIILMERKHEKYVGQYNKERHLQVIQNSNEKHFSFFEQENGELVGYAILAGFEEQNKSLEFRRLVISKKGIGFGKKALQLVKKQCFGTYKTARLWLDVLSDNHRAIQLYEKEGFTKEKQIADNINEGGGNRSMWIMAIHSVDYILNPVNTD